MNKYLVVVNFYVITNDNNEFGFEKSIELEMSEAERYNLENFMNFDPESWKRMWASTSPELNQQLNKLYSTVKNYANQRFDDKIQLLEGIKFYKIY